MKAVLYKEFKTVLLGRQFFFIYGLVLLLWGILQPVAAFLSLADPDSPYNLTEHFFYSTNFITFSAFFLMISITQSTQSFIGERHSKTLNTLLAFPVKIRTLVVGKWLSIVLVVTAMAVSVFAVEWLVYGITIKAMKLDAPFVFPSLGECARSFLLLVLLWGVTSWYGAFAWLKFETYQAANMVAVLFILPLITAEYLAIEYAFPLVWVLSLLSLLVLCLGVTAIRCNHRDRLAQMS